jgi:hypothetical protein
VPSPAATQFFLARDRALIIHRIVGDHRLRPQNQPTREVFCHAALAAMVAAWNAYINNLINNVFAAISDPLDVRYSALHSMLYELSARASNRFNTPNAENSRELLVLYTGYDPINDWVWSARGSTGIQVRERLNQILKVRHSFAHGFAIPAYSWTQSSTGRVRLTKSAVTMVGEFFVNLVKRTDRGMSAHVRRVFSKSPW